MNLLTDALPITVDIGGQAYDIRADFRAGIEFELMVESGEEDPRVMLRPFFPWGIPRDIEGALQAVMAFYCCGALPDKTAGKPTKTRQAYSFRVDAGAIFADFWRYYGLDLTQDELHWWAFRELLMGLPEKSEFKQRAYYRTCDLKGMSKKERERILKIRAGLDIKAKTSTKQTLEERDAAMLEYMARRRADTAGGEP